MKKMKLLLSVVLAICVLISIGMTSFAIDQTVILNFDELSGQGNLPTNYGGLTWESNWGYYDWPQSPYNPSSNPTRVYNNSNPDAWIDFSSLGQPVQFVGASFAGSNSVYFEGYRNGVLIGTSNILSLSSTPSFLYANFGHMVDKVIVNVSPGSFVMDDLTYSYQQIANPKQVRGNHELVTLLTNPTDGTGVRTLDLNYYLNDPIIWGTDVKNITVWLESEIFDLAKAQQKAKLPAGLSLLKDYNIRLMMKIVYNDGTVETKEVDNAHIARNIPVLIPVDEFAGINDLGIVYMDTQGHTAVLPVTSVTIDGMNYLQFENNHFSEYGVVSGTAQAPTQQQQYIIQPSDTLASIAAKFGVTVQSLANANNISNLDLIYAGKVLIIA